VLCKALIALSPDGTITTESGSDIIPPHVLRDICSWRMQGISMKDIVDRLRPRTVPSGYTFHVWKEGIYDKACYFTH